MSKSITLDSVKAITLTSLQRISRYRIFIFFLIAAVLYGSIIWRINTLATSEPSALELQTAANNQAVPVIKPSIVKKIQDLKDNSVSVQALFEQARNNPFSE